MITNEVNKGPNDLASEWKEAFNSHDLDRILALYSEDVVSSLLAFAQYQGRLYTIVTRRENLLSSRKRARTIANA